MTTEHYIKFLQSHGTVRNWQPIIMYNYGGRLSGYEGGPDWAIYNYRFNDGSIIVVRCSYGTGQQTVEFLIKDTVVATISCNYMNFKF